MTARRRWFRFGLRMLFVVVTIACVFAGWIAYQLDWIRERHDGRIDTSLWRLPDPSSTAPWPLWLFGEEGIERFVVSSSDPRPSRYVEKLMQLFPESKFEFQPLE